MHRFFLILPIILASAVLGAQGPRQDFAGFVDRYTDDWMRFHTNAAVARRYFTGAEQDALERQIEPQTKAQRDREVELIRRGLGELARFDRAGLAPADRRSYDVITWDLQTQLDSAAFDDDYFPYAQNYGVDAGLISTLTVNHTVRTVSPRPKDSTWRSSTPTRPCIADHRLRRTFRTSSGSRPPPFIA